MAPFSSEGASAKPGAVHAVVRVGEGRDDRQCHGAKLDGGQHKGSQRIPRRLLHLRGQRAGIDSQAQGRDQHRGRGDLGGQGLEPLIGGGRVAVLAELG
jgi:hypothetical protein